MGDGGGDPMGPPWGLGMGGKPYFRLIASFLPYLDSSGLDVSWVGAGVFTVFTVFKVNVTDLGSALTGAKITVPALFRLRQHTVRQEKAEVVMATTA